MCKEIQQLKWAIQSGVQSILVLCATHRIYVVSFFFFLKFWLVTVKAILEDTCKYNINQFSYQVDIFSTHIS